MMMSTPGSMRLTKGNEVSRLINKEFPSSLSSILSVSRGAPDRRRIIGTPTPQAELVSRVIGDHFARFGGHLSQPPAPDCVLTPIQFLGQFPLRTTKK